MSAFSPSAPVFDPPNMPGALPAALVNALSRRFAAKLSWSYARTLVAGLPTAGIAPLLILSWRFDDYAQAEHQNLHHLAQWLSLDSGDVESAQLVQAAQPPRSASQMAVIWACVAIAILSAVRFFTLQSVSLYGWLSLLHFRGYPPSAAAAAPGRLFAWAIVAAALAWLYQVNSRASQVRSYALIFNRIAARQNLAPVHVPRFRLGLRPRWFLTGLALACLGAFWALPLFLAAAVHRRYILAQSLPMRLALSDRVRQMLSRRRPAMFVPTPARPSAACAHPRCSKNLPAGAIYCPRCGKPTG